MSKHEMLKSVRSNLQEVKGALSDSTDAHVVEKIEEAIKLLDQIDEAKDTQATEKALEILSTVIKHLPGWASLLARIFGE